MNIEWETHEGMVTVYDSEGRYRGCLGIETWLRIVGGAFEEAEARLAKADKLAEWWQQEHAGLTRTYKALEQRADKLAEALRATRRIIGAALADWEEK
jgi:hypothetical protein